MRTIVLVLLTMLMVPSVASAHIIKKKPHPKLEDHKHAKAMKQAAQDCCRAQEGHHGLHHGAKKKHKFLHH